MQGKSPNSNQQNFLYPDLLNQLDPKSPLMQLAKNIPWTYFEEEFASFYSQTGRPSKPVRLMVGLCILKHVENLSDEVLINRWVQNPYYQAFCGATEFQWKFPCDPTDLVYFRKRIGKEGFEKILAVSIAIHDNAIHEVEACVDTTVQEKNITFPTDDKLHRKIINHCWKIAENNDITLRRSYRRELKTLLLNLRFRNHPRNYKKSKKASKRLKTIAGALVRELKRKLSSDKLALLSSDFELYEQVINQKKSSKNKIYSLHEPHVYCMSKGKLHKKYEFGTKASIAKTKGSNLIVGALAFSENKYDGHTLPVVLEQIKRISNWVPKIILCDRGYRGTKHVDETEIMIPTSTPKKLQTRYYKTKQRKRFRRRAAIEPVIGHLKSDHRLGRNFLSGFIGDEINLLMAAAAFNFKKWLNDYFLRLIFLVLYAKLYQKHRGSYHTALI